MSGLDELALGNTATLTLLHPATGKEIRVDSPTGEKDEEGDTLLVPITIDLIRSDSKEAAEHNHQRKNRHLRRAGKKGAIKLTAAEMEEESLSLLVFCTKGWSNVSLDGQHLNCTASNVRRLYSDPRFTWIRSQVDEFIGDEANFLGNSSKS